MAQLSLFMEMLGQQEGQRFDAGIAGPRTSVGTPAKRGFARGTMGVLGAKPLQSRNSDAGLDKERQKLLESPVMQAFMRIHRKKLLF